MANSPPESKEEKPRNDKQYKRHNIQKNIRMLRLKSLKGLIVLVFFLLISMAAIDDFRILPALSPELRAYLGAAPSPDLISIALLLYLVSALILTFLRVATSSMAHGGFTHLGYLLGFYTFYHFADRLMDHFWAVFVTGITVIGLESYHLYLSCGEALKQEEEEYDSLKTDDKE